MALTQIPAGMIAPAQTFSLNGVTFPATQVPSADANTLDDYEEGTWTPTITSGMSSVSYSNQLGTYTKIGRQVNFQFLVAVTGGTRNVNRIFISLPFSASGTSPAKSFGAYWTYTDTSTLSSSTTNVPFLYIGDGTANLEFYNASGGSFTGNDLASTNPSFYIAGSFITG